MYNGKVTYVDLGTISDFSITLKCLKNQKCGLSQFIFLKSILVAYYGLYQFVDKHNLNLRNSTAQKREFSIRNRNFSGFTKKSSAELGMLSLDVECGVFIIVKKF